MEQIKVNLNNYLPRSKPRALILSELATKMERTPLFFKIYLAGIPDRAIEDLIRSCDVDAKPEIQNHWQKLFWIEAKKLRERYPKAKKPKQIKLF